MANNAEAARARRKLRAAGAKKLGNITVADPATWTEILHEENVLPFWRDGKELTEAQLRDATEKLISEMCQDRRREKAEEILQRAANIRTGYIERQAPLDPAEPPAMFSTNFSAGGHWSFRPGQKKDRGRTFTAAELEDFLDERADLQEDLTEAEVMQERGMRIIGDE